MHIKAALKKANDEGSGTAALMDEFPIPALKSKE